MQGSQNGNSGAGDAKKTHTSNEDKFLLRFIEEISLNIITFFSHRRCFPKKLSSSSVFGCEHFNSKSFNTFGFVLSACTIFSFENPMTKFGDTNHCEHSIVT